MNNPEQILAEKCQVARRSVIEVTDDLIIKLVKLREVVLSDGTLDGFTREINDLQLGSTLELLTSSLIETQTLEDALSTLNGGNDD